MSRGFLSSVCDHPLGALMVVDTDCMAAFASILTSVIVAMVGVGVEKPRHGPIEATVDTNLYKAFLAVCNIVFSFCLSPSIRPSVFIIAL